jgi:hypothetical protein
MVNAPTCLPKTKLHPGDPLLDPMNDERPQSSDHNQDSRQSHPRNRMGVLLLPAVSQ